MIMTNRRGPHTQMTGLPNQLPFFKAADYQSYVARLSAMPEFMEKATARLQAGIEAGWVQPCAPMEGFETSIQTHIVSDVSDSNLMSPFKKKPASMNQAAFDKFKAQAETQIKNDILPALKKFESFYLNDYAPACRTTVGASFMPGGAEYYAHRVKLFTTTNRTPDEVHNIGLSEVARIRAEMDEVQKQNFLRTSPEFYPKTRQERMDAAAIILKKMDGKLPELFTKFPRMPYGLTPRKQQRPIIVGPQEMAPALGFILSIRPISTNDRSMKWKLCLCMKPCRDIIFKSPSPKNSLCQTLENMAE